MSPPSAFRASFRTSRMIPSSDRNIGVQSSVPSALRRRMRSFLIQKRHQRGGPNLRPRTVSTRRSNTTLLWSQKATANLWISRSAMTRSEFGFPHSRTSYRQRKLDSLSSSLNSWRVIRSEEHTSELQSLMRISYAVFCLKKKKQLQIPTTANTEKINYSSYY